MRQDLAVLERFVGALAEMDWSALERTLHPEARLRALLPPGFFEVIGRSEVVGRFRKMFEFATLELLSSSAEEAMDRLKMMYRFRQVDASGAVSVAEQSAFCDLKDGRIAAMDLVCSGDRPLRA